MAGPHRSVGRDECACTPQTRTRAQADDGDVWLAFAPIKRARIDLIAEKATELGAARLIPVVTERTQAARVNVARLRSRAIEAGRTVRAAHGAGRVGAGEVDELTRDWPDGRRLLVCAADAPPLATVLAADTDAHWAVLIGPEGGFSPREVDGLRQLPFVRCVGLGPRILRAETAAHRCTGGAAVAGRRLARVSHAER